MKIAIIGTGNVGSALAKGFAKAGHEVITGSRDVLKSKNNELANYSPNISQKTIKEAISEAEIVVFTTPPAPAVEVAGDFPELKSKIIIDTTNALFNPPAPFKTAFEGIKAKTGSSKVVKCFNSTGAENMENPRYGNIGIDMFMAGSDLESKNIVAGLAKDLGFDECYDFGGDDRVELLEQLAFSWINLAIFQKNGRNFAFKIIKR